MTPLLLKFFCIIELGSFIVSVESFSFPHSPAASDSDSSSPSITNTIIRLASWNILAQEYIDDDDVEEDSSSSTSSSESSNMINNLPNQKQQQYHYLEWKYRRKLIDNQLKHIDADIICLQEVQVDTWDEFYSEVFASTHEGYIQDVGHDHNVATATLIKKQCQYQVDRIESRSRALLVVLKKKETEKNNDISSSNTNNNNNNATTLYLWNVHLEAGKQQLNDFHRFCQLKSLFRRLRYHCSLDDTSLENSCVVIAGDFNMLRKHPNYKGLTIGEIENPNPQSQQQRNNNNNKKKKKSMKKKKKKQNKPQIIKTMPLIDSYGSHHNNYFPGVNTANTNSGSRQHYLLSSSSSTNNSLDNDRIHYQEEESSSIPTKRQKLIKTYCGGFVLDYIWHSPHVNIKDSLLFHPSATTSLIERWPSSTHPSDHIPIGIELEL